MSLTAFVLGWTPVLLLAGLAIWGRKSALALSVYSLGYVLILAGWYFQTPLRVMALAGLDGVLTTLPLLLVVFFGILLAQLFLDTGALPQLLAWLLGGLPTPLARQVVVAFGLANFFEGASIIAEPIIAPMLLTVGVPPAGAAALSIVGYAGLMGVEMAGIIITVLALITGLPYSDLGVATAWWSLPATLLLALAVPCFLPAPQEAWRRLPLILGSALVVALTALAGAIWLGVAVAGMVGGLALILISLGSRQAWRWPGRELGAILIPLALIFLPLILVNSWPALRQLTQQRLVLVLQVLPHHQITFTPFFSAYLYLGLALLTAKRLLGVSREAWRCLLAAGAAKGWRALLAMGLFGAMGQIIAFSGSDPAVVPGAGATNIPFILASGLKHYAGAFYPLFVPFLGWTGTFLTGYGVASLMLFGDLQLQAAAQLGLSATTLAAALTVGAAVGSISSPFKIAIATPMCQAVGQEGAILRLTIPIGATVSLLLGLLLWVIV